MNKTEHRHARAPPQHVSGVGRGAGVASGRVRLVGRLLRKEHQLDIGRLRQTAADARPDVRGGERRLTVRMAASRELPKLESACTTVVIGRG